MEAAVGGRHLAQEPRRGLAHWPDEALVARAVPPPRLGGRAQELALVVEHLLEVRDTPVPVDAVAMEAAAELVVDAAERHLAAALHRVRERVARLRRRE